MSQTHWQRIDASPEFRKLVNARKRFIVPAFIFFCTYYFTLPVLAGWFPELMKTKVAGPLNVAYLFALSQFFMAWIVALLYVRAAAKFDRMAAAVVEQNR
ncbi:MAG: hypothetical protein JWN34_5391 [Bryobacterales bacterium]|jgi:uncharacterized membrane protein (DUF485 family)|nr:hypothetical protein [Bryobacterales bacterium]